MHDADAVDANAAEVEDRCANWAGEVSPACIVLDLAMHDADAVDACAAEVSDRDANGAGKAPLALSSCSLALLDVAGAATCAAEVEDRFANGAAETFSQMLLWIWPCMMLRRMQVVLLR